MPLLTDVLIRQTKSPSPGRRVELWDAKVAGLIFRVTDGGFKTWSVLYRFKGTRKRFTLGPYRIEGSAADGLTLAEARARARVLLRGVADGRDPQAEKVRARAEAGRAGGTFQDLAEEWLRSPAAAEWRPKTRTEFARITRVELVPPLGDLAPEAVTKAHIRVVYDRIAARSQAVAKHTLAVLRLLYRWASEEDHVDAVPAFPKRGTQSNRRARVLEDGELRTVWGAFEAGLWKKPGVGVDTMAEAFRLMLLTAQRRGEVLSMRWADVTQESDGAWWTIPAERHKSGREQRVPLTAPAVESLKRLHGLTGSGDWVFPSPKPTAKAPHVTNPQKAAGRLWHKAGVTGATLHDLRRTAATFMTRLGVNRLVVGKVLGHADTDVTGRYDKHAYGREKRAALERWAGELQRITSSKGLSEKQRVLPWRQ